MPQGFSRFRASTSRVQPLASGTSSLIGAGPDSEWQPVGRISARSRANQGR